MKIAIYLNKEHPAFTQIQKDLSEQLDALETIKFKQDIEPAKPGTLGIPADVVAFFANHYKDILLVSNGIINFLSFIEKRRGGNRKKKASKINPSLFVLVVGSQ
jgi:hypothetical protein